MPAPGQHVSKAHSAGGCAGLVWEQGQGCCQCSMESLRRGTRTHLTSAAALLLHPWGLRMMGPNLGRCTQLDSASPCPPGGQIAAPGLSIALLQRIGFRATPPAAAGLRASPPGASGSVGAGTIPAHHQHPGRSRHHGDVFLPQMPSPREPPLPHRGAGMHLILPVALPGLGCVVFLFLL